MNCVFRGIVLAALILAAAVLHGQMVNPDIDKKGEPFSWASVSTDEMALPGAELGTEMTPEGYLYTGYGELVFLTGYPPRFARQRIRTLEGGNLPIFHYRYPDGSVRYDVTTFTYPLRSDEPDRHPVNMVQVTATNSGSTTRTSYFNVAFRYTGRVSNPHNNGDYRFLRPWTPDKTGDYLQPGVQFDPNWKYEFDRNYAVRAGAVVYQFPLEPKPAFWSTRMRVYMGPQQLHVLGDSPVLMTQYALHLAAGASQTLIFRMPVEPIKVSDTEALARLGAIDFEQAMNATAERWRKALLGGIRIRLPEKKVVDAFDANLIYDMMSVDRLGDDYVQKVSKLHYHTFWLRDSAVIISAYDATGNFQLAKRCLLFFLKYQRPDGLFVSNEGQYDGWGQTLWTFGRHYRFTNDKEFAKTVYPSVRRAVEWLRAARQKDPLRLIPAGNPGDNEFSKVSAHVTGHSFWTLAGLGGAIALAQAAGTEEDVREFRKEYDDYHEVLMARLREVTSKTDGYIPPGLDVKGGQDWGNMSSLYPEVLLPPSDPMVTGTLRATRAKYGEGLMTYAGWLHHYISAFNTQSAIVRGEQEQVIKDLYAMLIHTSSTHAGWEFARAPWTARDFVDDLAPHGTFSAEYVMLLRNMLLREQDRSLHLLSALSPEWTKPGDSVEVQNAPTYFGRLGMKATFRADGMALDLDATFRSEPDEVLVHLPSFVTPKGATADGKEVKVADHRLAVPSTTRRIDVTWTREPGPKTVSFDAAVNAFKREYAQRYQQFLRDGSPEAKLWEVQ